jgi:hypothetical protein
MKPFPDSWYCVTLIYVAEGSPDLRDMLPPVLAGVRLTQSEDAAPNARYELSVDRSLPANETCGVVESFLTSLLHAKEAGLLASLSIRPECDG